MPCKILPQVLLLFLFTLLCEVASGQLHALNDEFNQACTLSDWYDVNVTEGWNIQPLEVLDVDQTNEGFMTLIPYTVTWFENFKGALIYKNVEGNFVVTTRVLPTNRAYDDMPNPGSQYSLAGIMLRRSKSLTTGAAGWSAGQENYIFLSAGYASTGHPTCPGCPGPHFEVKNTINSNSNLEVSSIDTLDVQIRVARINDAIIVLYRLTGGDFLVHRRYSRSDFPDSMQLGMVTYTDYPKANTYTTIFQNSHVLNDDLNPDPSNNPGLPFNPDLVGRFDYLRFDSVAVPGPLMGLDLTNPGQVSDQQLLDFLGYPSEPHYSSAYRTWTGRQDNDWLNSGNWVDGIIPASGDSVLISSCDCALSNNPEVFPDTLRLGQLMIEEGGRIVIPEGSAVLIGESGNPSTLVSNRGMLDINGHLILLGSAARGIDNWGELNIGEAGYLISEIQDEAIHNFPGAGVTNDGHILLLRED